MNKDSVGNGLVNVDEIPKMSQVRSTTAVAEYEPLNGASKDKWRKKDAAKYMSDYDSQQNGGSTDLVIDDVIDSTGFGLFQVLVLFGTGILWMSDGLEVFLVSILSPVLLCEWHLSPWQEALITTTSYLGYLIGSPLFGTFSDIFGRKQSLVLGACWVLFYGILSASSPDIYWLLILRLLVGIGLGAVPQAVTLYAEFAPSRHRGKAVVLIEVFFALGSSLAALLAILTLERYGWRVWLLSCAIPSIVFLTFVYWLPESPRFHLITGQSKKAWETLGLAARINKSSLLSGQLVQKYEGRRGRILDLVLPSYRKVSFLLAFLWFVSVFVYVGMMLLATQFIELGTTCPAGGRSISSQASEMSCFLECGKLTSSDLRQIFITTFGELPGLFITAVLVDTVGRKFAFVINFGVTIGVFVVLLFCIEKTTILVIFFIGRAMSAALLQIAFLYTPEVYPTPVRSVALGMGSAIGRVGAMVTPYIAQVVLKQSIVLCLIIYASVATLGLISALLLPAETKGKNLK